MIKLFVCDIDGCLAEPYRPFDLGRFAELRHLAEEAGGVGVHEALPALTICSGRPHAYVEAMTQALGLRTPVLFESGGGLFDPVAAQITWNPDFSAAMEEQLEQVRRWMKATCLPGTKLFYDYGKRTQAGVMGPDVSEIEQMLPRVEAYVASKAPALRVYHTHVSIDVLPKDITKVQGLRWLGEVTGIAPRHMAYIGDTNGDIDALRLVGHAFAPANATEAVRHTAHYVTEGEVIAGTLAAYRRCVAHNRAYEPAAS